MSQFDNSFVILLQSELMMCSIMVCQNAQSYRRCKLRIKQCLSKCTGSNNSMSNERLRKALLQDNAVPEVSREIPAQLRSSLVTK